MGMYNFDKDGTPDYNTWLKMKECEKGTRPDQELYKYIGKAVDKQYEGTRFTPPNFEGEY